MSNLSRLLAPLIALPLWASVAHADLAQLNRNLPQFKASLPDIQIKVLGESPIKGLYELQMDGQLVYTDETLQYLLNGELFDLKHKVNLTAQRQQQINTIDVRTLPLAQAIKTVKGTGARTLYIFSDPDCPYCKKLEQNLDSISDVTIYTFLFPLKSLHPEAETRAKQIWCAPDRAAAWRNYMLKGQVPSATNTTCDTPIAKNSQLGSTLNIGGTPTVFLSTGQRLSGALSTAQLQQLLR